MARDKPGEVVRGQFIGSLVFHVREFGFYAAANGCKNIYIYILSNRPLLKEKLYNKSTHDEKGLNGLGPNCLAS